MLLMHTGMFSRRLIARKSYENIKETGSINLWRVGRMNAVFEFLPTLHGELNARKENEVIFGC